MNAAASPLIIGAGPAGLTAALRLAEHGVSARIFEATGHVGGLARTPGRGQWRVDPGGHRFFTKDAEVLDIWNSLLPQDQWLSVRRRSAMLVDGQFVSYPLRGRDLLTQLGVRSGLRGLGNLLWSRLRRRACPVNDSATFRQWGAAEFGHHWYRLFFDGYVRKTWMVEPDDIASSWAQQRIKPIDWRLRTPAPDQDVFRYPRLGPGQLWEAAAAALADTGVHPVLNSRVVQIRPEGGGWTIELHNGDTATGDAVFSSMPLQTLIEALEPAPPEEIRVAAANLRHRCLITVAIALRTRHDIPFNWVYTPGRNFRVGRIQNYTNWSPALAPQDWAGTYLGLEYFTLPDDDLWIAGTDSLGTIVEQDLRELGIPDTDIEHVDVVRSLFAYPIYDP
ncbi:MAG: UDP-galactopyranose mutase, partial [Mycobacterium sp.]|nr:UDP-galactopyranose mutase [Mycobacterium sp.]